jgi:FtsP/CotA-like multicopper oxidase with cupredoxin domain
MTRNQRIGLLVAAVAVAVVAFVIAQSGGDDGDDNGNTPAPAASGTGSQTDTDSDVAPEAPTTFRLTLKDAEVVGGVKTLTATKGDTVTIVISSDAPDQVHLHGYDIEKEAEPGKPARLRFKANVEGAFELESHTAEHEGKEPLIGRLHVEP